MISFEVAVASFLYRQNHWKAMDMVYYTLCLGSVCRQKSRLKVSKTDFSERSLA